MRIGIDLGGTKIEGILLDDGGAELRRLRVPTPAARGYAAIIESIVDLVSALEEGHEQATVGVGAPGTVSHRTGRIKNSNTQCLLHKPLADDLQSDLGETTNLWSDRPDVVARLTALLR